MPDAVDTDDWPMVGRDPANTGHSPHATVPDDVRVAWRRTDFGAYYSPVVFDGRVYVGRFDGISAFDAATGERLFGLDDRVHGAPAVALTDAYVDPSLVATGRLGLLGLSGGGGVRLPDGSARWGTRWTLSDPNEDELSALFFRPQTGRPSAAVVADGKTFVVDSGAPGRIAQVDAGSGTLDWTLAREDNGFRLPAVAEGVAYAVAWPDRMVALERDGTICWEVPFESHIANRPAVADGAVVVPGADRVVAFETDDGSERWSRPADSFAAFDETAPAVTGDTAYVPTSSNDTPRTEALDLATGERRWSAPHGCSEASPVVAGDTVLVPADDALYALDSRDGSERWSFEPTYPGSLTTPAVSAGRVYVSTHSSVYALEAAR